MKLTKQSIRSHMVIKAHNIVMSKDELITMSHLWTDKQIAFFKKMIKQGGSFKINGVPFDVSVEQRSDVKSDGNLAGPITKIPGDGRF